MAARSPLAKLTRPKLYDALPRPRLFALLDQAAKRPIVWVCAAPGAGKTTLVASYLEARPGQAREEESDQQSGFCEYHGEQDHITGPAAHHSRKEVDEPVRVGRALRRELVRVTCRRWFRQRGRD